MQRRKNRRRTRAGLPPEAGAAGVIYRADRSAHLYVPAGKILRQHAGTENVPKPPGRPRSVFSSTPAYYSTVLKIFLENRAENG